MASSIFAAYVARRMREIASERKKIDKQIESIRPSIGVLAAKGTANERKYALRWLALYDSIK